MDRHPSSLATHTTLSATDNTMTGGRNPPVEPRGTPRATYRSARLGEWPISHTPKLNAQTQSNLKWIWLIWLIVFYVCWLVLVLPEGQWALVEQHWPIALSMTVGSYAAGATPMGGGTIGFPVLVMFFEMPASLGRDFSFAIQSIGMTSASIYILVRRQPLAWTMLSGAALAALIGTPMGILFLAPLVPELWIKVLFAIIWASFGILHLVRINEISLNKGVTSLRDNWNFKVGFIVGLLSSSMLASITGVGIDMMLYCSLVLLCRADLKIAIPTSVVIMAFTSLVGMLTKWLTGDFQEGVYGNWLAAAPVVILGAPLGVFIANRIGRKSTIYLVALLCIGQYAWMCFNEFDYLKTTGVAISLGFVLFFFIVFEALRFLGAKLLLNSK